MNRRELVSALIGLAATPAMIALPRRALTHEEFFMEDYATDGCGRLILNRFSRERDMFVLPPEYTGLVDWVRIRGDGSFEVFR